LDFGEEDFNNDSIFERSFSSDGQQHELNSSFDSKINILDDDFNSDKTNLQKIILPSPITITTTIPKQEQKSLRKTFLDRCQPFLMLEMLYSAHSPLFFYSC